MKTLLNFLVWYLIFWFVTGEYDPMQWSTFAKVVAVIISIILVEDTK